MYRAGTKSAWAYEALSRGVTLAEAVSANALFPNRKPSSASDWHTLFCDCARDAKLALVNDKGVYRLGSDDEKQAVRKARLRFNPDELIPWLEAQYQATGYAFGARGWGYFVEGHNIIDKDGFAAFEAKLAEWRKQGLLDPNVVSDDDARSTQFIGYVDDDDPEDYARQQLENAKLYLDIYQPVNFWEGLDTHIEVLVEKSDLVTIFEDLCRRYHVPLTNAKGAFDVNGRRRMLQRFRKHHEAGRNIVLLYFGDFDPIGVRLSDSLLQNLIDCCDIQDVQWSAEGNVVVERVGLSLEQIEDLGLTWVDNLVTSSGKNLADPEHKLFKSDMVQDWLRDFGERKVEANALVRDPASAQQLLEDAIIQYVPASHLAHHEASLEPHREAAREAFRKVVAEER